MCFSPHLFKDEKPLRHYHFITDYSLMVRTWRVEHFKPVQSIFNQLYQNNVNNVFEIYPINIKRYETHYTVYFKIYIHVWYHSFQNLTNFNVLYVGIQTFTAF